MKFYQFFFSAETENDIDIGIENRFFAVVLKTCTMPFVIMDYFCQDCRARSDGTYVQSDLGLQSPLLHQLFLSASHLCRSM